MLPALRGAVRRLALAARPVRLQLPHLGGGGAKRMMGGASGAPHHHQPKQAFLFNEGPGPRKVEIWEPITSITYWATFFILVFGLASGPETRIKEWAAEEAEVRLARLDDGKEVEYGKIYQKQALAAGFKAPSALEADSPSSQVEDEEDED